MASVTTALQVYGLAGVVDGAQWVQLGALTHEHTELVGSATIMHADTVTPTLVDVFVHEAHRRTGVATALVRAAKRWADEQSRFLYLHVLPENPARLLYEQQGFEYTGEVKDDGAWWMVYGWDEEKEAPG